MPHAQHDNSFLLLGLLSRLGDLSSAGGLLLHRLDDADGHGLPHVAHGEATCGDEGDAKSPSGPIYSSVFSNLI